jgi:CRISPR system Cascade subunit CasD
MSKESSVENSPAPGASVSEEDVSSSGEDSSSRRHLLFQLHGALASWGDVAVGEVRPTYDRPSKSAVLGLVAAALGIGRSEEEKHQALTEGYRFAVRLDVPGRPLRDYHTTETPTGKRARGLTSRRDEIEYKSTTTIQSYRDYRCDALATACLWTSDSEAPWSLSEIAAALRTPEFMLYLGRKACSPSLPLAPEVVAAGSLREALENTGVARGPLAQEVIQNASGQQNASGKRGASGQRGSVRIYWEAPPDASNRIGFDADQVQQRRDELVSRRRWQYQLREESVATLPTNDPAVA